VRIRIHDFTEATQELVYQEPTQDLNALFEQGPVHDYHFVGPSAIRVTYYRSGQELFVSGEAASEVVGACARCLIEYVFRPPARFAFVFVPQRRGVPVERDREDPDFCTYAGDEIDLSPLVRERILLALPTLPLCAEGCRGLCTQCGTNLNTDRCECRRESHDLRFAALGHLKVGR
jgi:uncharacterized protein